MIEEIREIQFIGGVSGEAGSPIAPGLLPAVAALDATASVYDPDNPDTWTLRDAAFYAGVEDGAGNRAEITQAADIRQPDQFTTSTGGRAFAVDNGVARLIGMAFEAEIVQPNTVLLAFRFPSTSTQQRVFDNLSFGADTGLDTPRQRFGVSSNSLHIWAGGANVTAAFSNTEWHIAQINFAGASSELYIDGALAASGNPGANGLGGVGLMSANTSVPLLSGGKVGPVVVFSGLQTNAATAIIRSRISERFPIGVSE